MKLTPSLYPQWLDGEVLLLKRLRTGISQSDVDALAERCLKTLALLRVGLRISDVQLIDSSALLRALADPQFRAFLNINPWFLEMQVRPQSSRASDMELTMSGYDKADEVGWKSSTFSTPYITKRVGGILRACDVIQPGSLLSTGGDLFHLKQQYPEHSELIDGMVFGAYHFSQPNRVNRASTVGSKPTLVSKLEEAIEVQGISDRNREALTETLDFINKLDRNDRTRRSLLLENLGEREKHSDRQQMIWDTIVFAWNRAVQDTVGAAGSSLTHLSERACSVGTVLDQTTAVLYPGSKPPTGSIDDPITFALGDPQKLSWEQIARVVRETEVSALKLREAVDTGTLDTIPRFFQDHLNLVAQKATHSRSSPYWQIALCVAPSVLSQLLGLPGFVGNIGAAIGVVLGGNVAIRDIAFQNTIHRIAAATPLDT